MIATEELDLSFLPGESNVREDRYYLLVNYDISDNRRRRNLVNLLKGFGYRVQESSFEMIIKKKRYDSLIDRIEDIVSLDDDNVRLYKIRGDAAIHFFGKGRELLCTEENIVI